MFSSIIGLLKEWWIGRKTKRKNAEYLAIHIVCMFDQYVEKCCDVVRDNGLYYGQYNESGCRESQSTLPEFDPKSVEVDWKSIPVKPMYDIINFPNLIDEANSRICAFFEHADPPDFAEGFEERQYQYAKLGIIALTISADLRNTYGIPNKQSGDLNLFVWFEKCKLNIEAIRNERANQQAVFMKGLG